MLRFAFCLFFTLLFCSSALAGFVVHKKVSNRDFYGASQTEETLTEYIDPDLGKLASQNYIMRFDTQEIIMLNSGQQLYYRNDIEGYCSDIEKMVTEMTSSPEYQQMLKMSAQITRESGQQTKPVVQTPVLNKIGSEKIAGYSADHFQLKIGAEIVSEVWLSTDKRLAALDFSKNKQLKKHAENFERRFESCASKFSQMSPDAEEVADPLADYTAYELRNRDSMSDTLTTSIEKAVIPASRFEPPTGYRQVPLRDMMSQSSEGAFSDRDSENNYQEMEQELSTREETADEYSKYADEVEDQLQRESSTTDEDKIRGQLKKGASKLLKLFGN